jgi:hypothetical protein
MQNYEGLSFNGVFPYDVDIPATNGVIHVIDAVLPTSFSPLPANDYLQPCVDVRVMDTHVDAGVFAGKV